MQMSAYFASVPCAKIRIRESHDAGKNRVRTGGFQQQKAETAPLLAAQRGNKNRTDGA